MIEILKPGPHGNVLATIAIGETYLEEWKKFAFPLWRKYCKKYNLGLIVIDQELIDHGDPLWKKPTWQKMLIGDAVNKLFPAVNNVCYLDTDILINSYAPNIFDQHDEQCISLVSQVKDLPFPLHETLRRVAFNRHHNYSEEYPLDSALFMTPQMIFRSMQQKEHDNYSCAGLIVFNVINHKNLMKSWFRKYTKASQTLTSGDEPAFNAEVQNWGRINWLPYEFQALWNYEMAWKYPFLYQQGIYNDEVKKACIRTSLLSNYFLHFAGSWYESDMWKLKDIMDENWIKYCEDYYRYLENNVTGHPKGVIKPS